MTTLIALNGVSAVVRETATLTRTEPATIPGHTRGPQSSTAASAIPDGGQTAVA